MPFIILPNTFLLFTFALVWFYHLEFVPLWIFTSAYRHKLTGLLKFSPTSLIFALPL